MCKVLMIPKITNKTRTNAIKFMNKMMPLMSQYNKDGLGYAAVDSTGALFGQRWHTNAAAYVKKAEDKAGPLLESMYETRFYVDTSGSTNTFGKVNLEDMTALTMHTRMATSGRVFENTHPFVYEDADTSLIHNGVISNVSDFKFKVSSCDSEAILISYLDAAVGKELANIQDMANKLTGYYACGVFSRDTEGNRVLDVFKGETASLFATYVSDLDSIVISTDKDNIVDACLSLGFSYSDVYSLKEGIAMRFDAAGDMIEKVKFKPRPRYGSYYNSTNTSNVYDATVKKFEKKSSGSNEKPKKAKTKGPLTDQEIAYLTLPPGIKWLPNYKPGNVQ